MPKKEELPNVYRTDFRAHVLVGGERYPLSLIESVFRLNEIPYAYLEIPLGIKSPRPAGSLQTDAPETSIGAKLINNLRALTPLEVKLTATSKQSAPKKKKSGFPLGKELTIFKGFILSPWVRKQRGGTAVAAVTAMGEAGLLSASTNYTDTINSDVNYKRINIRFGRSNVLVRDLTRALRDMPLQPTENVAQMILNIMLTYAKELTNSQYRNPKEGAKFAVPYIEKIRVMTNSGSGGPDVERMALKQGGLATPLSAGGEGSPVDYEKMLNWSVSRHLADLLYAGWAVGLGNGGGDLWTFMNLALKSFMLSYIPRVGSYDAIVPLYYGANLPPFRIIDQNEYWGFEIGKTFNPKDYSVPSGVLLYSPRSPIPVADGNVGVDLNIPVLGNAHYLVRAPGASGGAPTPVTTAGEVMGRLQTVECPSWAVPPSNLSPAWLGSNENPPEAGSPDDTAYNQDRPATEFWFDEKLGDRIAQWILGDIIFAHRVVALRGRLRFDIAPGSLVQVNVKDSIFEETGQTKLFGYVAEVRNLIGQRARGSTARTMLTLGHVYTGEEQTLWRAGGEPRPDGHPVYAQNWTGVHLVDGAEE